MDVYDKFPSQTFELLDGGASVIKKERLGVSFMVRMIVKFWETVI